MAQNKFDPDTYTVLQNKDQNLQKTLDEIRSLPNEISQSLTGKRREIFEAVQEGEVKA